MRLLIVDDLPANRKLLRAQLEAENHQVVEAANGVEALAVLSGTAVDAVIADILMPQMDGFRLCQEVRKDQRMRTVPLILYTSTYDSPGDRELARTVGADGYLIKPAPTDDILAALGAAQLSAAQRRAQQPPPADERYVLQEYNAALVRKLETRNADLIALNRSLEARVEERTAELRQANRELESFAHSVSHDLRAPLRHITGFAEFLEQSAAPALDAQQREYLERIVSAAARMDQLIQALLEFSLAGRAELNVTNMSLEAVADEAFQSVQVDTRGRNIEWRRGPLPRADGDRTLLRQVFVNLFANAIKYTRTRDAAIIEIGCESGSVNPAVFVRDNGVGFDMKYRDRLFSVFGRLHGSEQFEGTGIGLANAQRIVVRHGGTIWAQGVVDGGATFYFSLPTLRW